jgi:FtsZ-binding cell division protein ZapB
VDDKSAKTLLGETFKRQAKDDNGFSSVTFICPKTDDISITEAIDTLELEDEVEEMYERQHNCEQKNKSVQDKIGSLQKARRSARSHRRGQPMILRLGKTSTSVWTQARQSTHRGPRRANARRLRTGKETPARDSREIVMTKKTTSLSRTKRTQSESDDASDDEDSKSSLGYIQNDRPTRWHIPLSLCRTS